MKNWFTNESMCTKMLAHWLENMEGWNLKKGIWMEICGQSFSVIV